MKQSAKKSFLALFLVLAVMLSACGGGGLSGTWDVSGDPGTTVKFSGSTITSTSPDGEIRKGTYSVTGDKIELKWNEDDDYRVESFSRTENTMTIGRERLTKK